ncbi:dihydrofolate reductase family protein [Arthrobacter sp.]|uniref:dihydrofolate reductase family protein n=1 Tax=Arthrobacter sp. TaxID=1667 RepID=UPI0028A0FC52|nr:dihydrofolate reductase family protein [Arthrobacter sp.]
MAKVIYYVASSLDGFIATEDNSLDWLLAFGFDSFQEHYDRFMSGVGAIIMGAETYDWLRAEQPDTWDYGELPCLVLTHRNLEAPPASGVRFVSGDVQPVLEQASALAEDRNVWVIGGGNTAAQFADAGLLDELWITYMPVALGSGRRLLPVTSPTGRMHLVGTTQFNGGAAELRFAVD